jgi:pyruvate dehydrogenase E2 component (dihydrolipoamide acetyltransferase)
MSTNVIMPQMGESIAEGTVTKWLKKVGERVERDEVLFEISTDKVDAEIPSPTAGVLANILVRENETVAVNTVVAVIDSENTRVETAVDENSSERALDGLPEQAQDRAPTSTPLESGSPPIPLRQASPLFASPVASGADNPVLSSPLVRRIARENQVDLSHIRGTGLGGRIRKQDILSHLQQGAATDAALERNAQVRRAPSNESPPPAPEIVFSGPTTVVPMSPMRKRIAEHMVASRRTSAHVTTVFEVEMTKVVAIRERHAGEFERRHGLKLNYTAFFVRAAAETIKAFPVFNSSMDGTNIVYKRDVNIGVAVALETGLIVPAIRNADEKNLLGIARAIQEIAERARSKRLRVEDVQGGTFTITNPGMFGSLFGSPIINQPQVAILAVGMIEKRAVVRDNAIAIRPMVYLSLSYDHRLIDGEVGARFLGRLKAKLEDWNEPVL